MEVVSEAGTSDAPLEVAAADETTEGKTEPTAEEKAAADKVAAEAATTAAAETEVEKLSRRERAKAKWAKERDDNRAEIDRLTSENAELKKRPAAAAPVVVPPAEEKKAEVVVDAAAPVAPNPGDFADGRFDEKFVDAMVDFKMDKREYDRNVKAKADKDRTDAETRQKQETEARATAERETAAAKERWTKSIQAAQKRIPDYDIVMSRPHPTPPAPMLQCVLDQERAAEIAHYLVTHPEEEKRISLLAAIPENASVAAQRRAYAKVLVEIEKIEEALPASDVQTPPEGDDDDPDLHVADEEDLSAARRVPQKQPAPAPAPAAPPRVAAPPAASPKPKVMTPVGGRGSTGNRSVKTLPPGELRKLDPLSDEYRRQVGMA